jgi:hypothetical protein
MADKTTNIKLFYYFIGKKFNQSTLGRALYHSNITPKVLQII